MSLPAWILPARGCLSFHFPPATSPTPGAAWKTAGIGVSSKAPFPVSLQLGIGVQGCTNTPECGGVSGDLDIVPSPPGFPAIPMSSSQRTRIPSQKRIPLATGREGFLCSDAVRMIPKQMWTIPVKMWMVWGRMRERDPNPVAVRRIPPQSHITMLGRDWDRHLSRCPLHSAGQSLWIPSPWKAASHPQHLGMSPLEALRLE